MHPAPALSFIKLPLISTLKSSPARLLHNAPGKRHATA
jgi:hypothetical protein